MEETHAVEPPAATGKLEERLSSAGWGLFVLWIGLAFLVEMAAWIALIGIGVITLGIQATRKTVGLALEGFWVMVGALFVLAGLWDLSGTTVPLLPVLLILAGLGAFGSALIGRRG